jgi:hypothetical protein
LPGIEEEEVSMSTMRQQNINSVGTKQNIDSDSKCGGLPSWNVSSWSPSKARDWNHFLNLVSTLDDLLNCLM